MRKKQRYGTKGLNKKSLDQRAKEFDDAEYKMSMKEADLIGTFNNRQLEIYQEYIKLREDFYEKASYIYKNVYELGEDAEEDFLDDFDDYEYDEYEDDDCELEYWYEL